LALALVFLAPPSTAAGARIELRPGQNAPALELVYTAGAGEVNYPLLQHYQTWWYLQDVNGPITERVAPCEATPDPHGLGVSSRCPDPGYNVSRAVIDLGDGDDQGSVDDNTSLDIPVSVLGGPGRDTISMHSFKGDVLDGGPGDDVLSSQGPSPEITTGGSDVVVGGDGNDKIYTRDDRRDVVSCGFGTDEATVDELDSVDADCETVQHPVDTGWVRADGLPVGVSINGAATYTNDPAVRLTVRAPDPATRIRISSDGGFANWLTLPRSETEIYSFEITSSGPERLPKTVYVRFDGPGLDPSRTFTDDIVLDETRPAIRSVKLIRRIHGGARIALEAHDSTSGVRGMQFARARTRPRAWARYRKGVTIARALGWLRVRDGAGNLSRWRHIRATLH
jgi:hypothetical protein